MQGVLRVALALAAAFLIGGVLLAVLQRDMHAPLGAFAALFHGAFGDLYALTSTLARTAPLLLTTLAVVLAMTVGLFNIGVEGQATVGAFVAAILGASVGGTGGLILALLCGALAGSLWAWLPAYLKIRRGVSEVITTLLLNYVARNTTQFLATALFKDPSRETAQTREILTPLPRLFAGHDLHAGIFIAIFFMLVFAFILRKTVWGFSLRATGQGAEATEAAGISPSRKQFEAMLLSGGIAGFAGAIVVLGATPFRCFPADFYGGGNGFEGLATALLTLGNPYAIFPAALFFGALTTGATAMEFETETPKQLAQILQALIIVGMGTRLIWKSRRRPIKQQRQAKP
jgi:general nucleoside transport system permease protein